MFAVLLLSFAVMLKLIVIFQLKEEEQSHCDAVSVTRALKSTQTAQRDPAAFCSRLQTECTDLSSWWFTLLAALTRLLWVSDRKRTRVWRHDPGPCRHGVRNSPELSVVTSFSHKFTSTPRSAAVCTHRQWQKVKEVVQWRKKTCGGHNYITTTHYCNVPPT